MLSLLCNFSPNNQHEKTPEKTSNKKYNDSQDYQDSFFALLRLCAKNKLFQNKYGFSKIIHHDCEIVLPQSTQSRHGVRKEFL